MDGLWGREAGLAWCGKRLGWGKADVEELLRWGGKKPGDNVCAPW